MEDHKVAPFDICCIGHITSDKIVTGGAAHFIPGGTAWYFSLALSRLPLNYLLVTAVGQPEIHYVTNLQRQGIKVIAQPSNATAFFENIYTDNHNRRTQHVLATADAFSAGQLENIEAKIFHLGPLMPGDIPVDMIKKLSAKGMVSLDVQGYLRNVIDRKVQAAPWPQHAEALAYVDILKADKAELKLLTGAETVEEGVEILTGYGLKEIVVTDGSQGSKIYSNGNCCVIPACIPGKVIDTTGCGDTYMAGYLYCRHMNNGIFEAGNFAAAMAGLKTAKAGPFTGTAEDVALFLKTSVIS